MSLLARFLLDLRGIQQSRNDCGGADAHRHSCFDKFVAALLACAFGIVIAGRHGSFSMAFGGDWKVA